MKGDERGRKGMKGIKIICRRILFILARDLEMSDSETGIRIGLIDGKFMDGREHKKKVMKGIKDFLSPRRDWKRAPKLVVVQVGNDPASTIYIKHKMRACLEVGIDFEKKEYDIDISEDKLISEIVGLNEDDGIDGYIIQLPLPANINVDRVVENVDPNKDIDCFHPENVGRLLCGSGGGGMGGGGEGGVRFEPPTPRGIVHLLREYGVEMRGKRVVIIGKSRIVGTPLSLMLSNEVTCGATVVLCDKWTEGIDSVTRAADVLVVCAGVRELIRRGTQIKKDAVLVDVGIHRVEVQEGGKRRIVGDIAKSSEIIDKCSMMSPSPGGCGCLTVAYLCLNLVKAFVNLHREGVDREGVDREGVDGKSGRVFCKDSDIIRL